MVIRFSELHYSPMQTLHDGNVIFYVLRVDQLLNFQRRRNIVMTKKTCKKNQVTMYYLAYMSATNLVAIVQ